MRLKLIGNFLSLIFGSGGLVAAIVSGGIALVGVSTVSLLIQGYMKHKNLDLKLYQCTYAYQSYQHLLNDIKEQLRSGNTDISSLYMKMQSLDDFVTDNAPVVDKLYLKYDEKFTTEE